MVFPKTLADGRYIVYVSTARAELSPAALDAILHSARLWNAENGITGALIYCDGSFMQYLEGPRDGLERTWERIAASRSHTNIVELINEPVQLRAFSQWHMGFSTSTRGQLRALLETRWGDDAPESLETGANGIGLLRHLMDNQRDTV